LILYELTLFIIKNTARMVHIISTKTLNGRTDPYSSNGNIFSTEKYIICSSGSSIEIWNIHTCEHIKTIKGHTKIVLSVFAINNFIISGDNANTIKVWDCNTFELINSINVCNSYACSEYLTKPVYSVFAINNYIINGSCDSKIRVRDINTLKVVKILDGHTDAVVSIFAINDFIISGSADTSIKIWSINTGKCINTLNGHSDRVFSVFAINNLIISGSADTLIKIWDITSAKCINTLTGHTDYVQSVFANNKVIISTSADRSIKIWDIKTYECINTFKTRFYAPSISVTNDKIIYLDDDEIIVSKYITNEQIFTALMCMWKLDYPTEIIHEIFMWLGINTYA
jgi:WD40 repeat protein